MKASAVMLVFFSMVLSLVLPGCASNPGTDQKMKMLLVNVSWEETPQDGSAEYRISGFTTKLQGSWQAAKKYELKEHEALHQRLPGAILSYLDSGALKEGERVIVRVTDGYKFIDLLAEVKRDAEGERYVEMRW